jgi:hypothetical protein
VLEIVPPDRTSTQPYAQAYVYALALHAESRGLPHDAENILNDAAANQGNPRLFGMQRRLALSPEGRATLTQHSGLQNAAQVNAFCDAIWIAARVEKEKWVDMAGLNSVLDLNDHIQTNHRSDWRLDERIGEADDPPQKLMAMALRYAIHLADGGAAEAADLALERDAYDTFTMNSKFNTSAPGSDLHQTMEAVYAMPFHIKASHVGAQTLPNIAMRAAKRAFSMMGMYEASMLQAHVGTRGADRSFLSVEAKRFMEGVSDAIDPMLFLLQREIDQHPVGTRDHDRALAHEALLHCWNESRPKDGHEQVGIRISLNLINTHVRARLGAAFTYQVSQNIREALRPFNIGQDGSIEVDYSTLKTIGDGLSERYPLTDDQRVALNEEQEMVALYNETTLSPQQVDRLYALEENAITYSGLISQFREGQQAERFAHAVALTHRMGKQVEHLQDVETGGRQTSWYMVRDLANAIYGTPRQAWTYEDTLKSLAALAASPESRTTFSKNATFGGTLPPVLVTNREVGPGGVFLAPSVTAGRTRGSLMQVGSSMEGWFMEMLKLSGFELSAGLTAGIGADYGGSPTNRAGTGAVFAGGNIGYSSTSVRGGSITANSSQEGWRSAAEAVPPHFRSIIRDREFMRTAGPAGHWQRFLGLWREHKELAASPIDESRSRISGGFTVGATTRGYLRNTASTGVDAVASWSAFRNESARRTGDGGAVADYSITSGSTIAVSGGVTGATPAIPTAWESVPSTLLAARAVGFELTKALQGGNLAAGKLPFSDSDVGVMYKASRSVDGRFLADGTMETDLFATPEQMIKYLNIPDINRSWIEETATGHHLEEELAEVLWQNAKDSMASAEIKGAQVSGAISKLKEASAALCNELHSTRVTLAGPLDVLPTNVATEEDERAASEQFRILRNPANYRRDSMWTVDLNGLAAGFGVNFVLQFKEEVSRRGIRLIVCHGIPKPGEDQDDEALEHRTSLAPGGDERAAVTS